MYLLSEIVQNMSNIATSSTVDDVANAVETAADTVANTQDNIIGIGGIIATVLVGFLSWLVTWKVTKMTIEQLKLAYSYQIFPILSKSVTKSTELNLSDLQIKYKDKLLPNPCLLTVDIINTGNKSINNPPIKIKNIEDIEIIPGYFEDVPSGYESLWKMEKIELDCCKLSLEHINTKQIVKSRFFLADFPKKEILFECPMADIQIQKMSVIDSNSSSSTKMNYYQKASVFLIGITVFLFLTMQQWSYYIERLIRGYNLENHLSEIQITIYIMTIFIMSIIFNAFRIKKLDNYILLHPKQSKIIKLIISLFCMVLLILMVCDFLIVYAIPQLITAIITAILIAYLIHISIIEKSNLM